MKGVLIRVGIGLLLLGLDACNDPFDYSPYETSVSAGQLTEKHLARLAVNSYNSFVPFRFAATADIHYRYEDISDWVNQVNLRDQTDFSLIAGDLTGLGLRDEFLWSLERMEELNAPFLTVIGNHDAINNGAIIYQKLYGPLNYSFVYNNVKFVFLNTNSWEFDYEAPDLDWLQNELADAAAYQHTILVSHIWPKESRFSEAVRQRLWQLLEVANIAMTVSGHNHENLHRTLYFSNGSPIQILITGSVDRRGYYEIDVQANAVTATRVMF